MGIFRLQNNVYSAICGHFFHFYFPTTKPKNTLWKSARCHLGLDGELAHRVDGLLAELLQCLPVGIPMAQSLTDGAGLLGPQVQWLELLAAVESAKVLLGLLVDHDVDASDGFADNTTGKEGNENKININTRPTYFVGYVVAWAAN